MTSFIIQGTSKPSPKPEKNTRSSLSLSTLHIFSTRLRPPHTAPAARFTPYINTTPYPLLSYCFSTNTRTNLGIGGPLANTPRVWFIYSNLFYRNRGRERRKIKGWRIQKWIFSHEDFCTNIWCFHWEHELYSTRAQGIRSSYFPIHRNLPNNHGWKQAHEE